MACACKRECMYISAFQAEYAMLTAEKQTMVLDRSGQTRDSLTYCISHNETVIAVFATGKESDTARISGSSTRIVPEHVSSVRSSSYCDCKHERQQSANDLDSCHGACHLLASSCSYTPVFVFMLAHILSAHRYPTSSMS